MIHIIYQIGDRFRLVALPNGGAIQVWNTIDKIWVTQDQWTET